MIGPKTKRWRGILARAIKAGRLGDGDVARVRWLLGRVHVAAPDRAVLRDMRRRIDRVPATDRRERRLLRRAVYCAALLAHDDNRAEYRAVLSGDLRPRGVGSVRR